MMYYCCYWNGGASVSAEFHQVPERRHLVLQSCSKNLRIGSVEGMGASVVGEEVICFDCANHWASAPAFGDQQTQGVKEWEGVQGIEQPAAASLSAEPQPLVLQPNREGQGLACVPRGMLWQCLPLSTSHTVFSPSSTRRLTYWKGINGA